MSKKTQTKVCLVSSVMAIDFLGLAKQGITTAIFDIEGTVAAYGTSTVSPEIIEFLKKTGLKHIGIVTNISKQDHLRVAQVAYSLGAHSYRFPTRAKERKPRAFMVTSMLTELGVKPKEVIMVGDKLFDVLAARRAGLYAVYWVDRYGKQDHWFDTAVYRNIEPLLKRWLVKHPARK